MADHHHGILQDVLDEALRVASDFFTLSNEHKAPFLSNDVNNPVRYGTSLKDGLDTIQFFKHYSHPLEEYIESWLSNPPNYR